MTLNTFTWATGANYSVGPDTGTPTKVNPSSIPNGFVSGVIAAPQHINYLLNALAAELLKAVDGVNGGSYTLAAPLTFLGADVHFGSDVDFQASASVSFAGPVDIAGIVNVNDGRVDLNGTSELNVEGAAHIDVEGSIEVTSGTVNVHSATGVTLVGGRINGQSGSSIIMAGGALVRIEDSGELTIHDSAEGFRLTLTPAFHDTIAPWKETTVGSGHACWVQNDVAAPRQIGFALPIPPGDSVVDVYVRVIGTGHGGVLPTSVPRIELFSVDIDGVVDVKATKDDPTSGADYDTARYIILQAGVGGVTTGAMPQVAGADPLYVRVIGEYNIAGGTTLTVRSVSGNIIARSYRAANMVY
jgi:hypothetical protein